VAFFGHCLGALSLFEAARRLIDEGACEFRHLFLSGARPPHALNALGQFEEELMARLTAHEAFDPLAPFHEQPEPVFADLIRHFDIGVTDEFLKKPELRRLLLPAIRADFELAAGYRIGSIEPWDVPITCFSGLDDRYATREDMLEWNRYTSREFCVHFREGTHFLIVEDRAFLIHRINAALAEPGFAPSPRRPRNPVAAS